MNPVRAFYDRLPTNTRIKIRSLVPNEIKRWYAHKQTDVYLISYPKCGRTWLRLMIGKSVAQHFSLLENEDMLFLRWPKKIHPDIPHITVIHEDRPMLKSPEELQTTKTKFAEKKIILLVRDPRDVIVSSYFEMKKRAQIFGDNPYEQRSASFHGSLEEFINQEQGGFNTILKYYNIWADNRQIPKDLLLVRYEDMRAEPQKELRKVIDFLGLSIISDEILSHAVEYASFDNMRNMEKDGKFSSGMLKPASAADKDSYKTRRGKIKGFVDYLDEKEIENLNQKMLEFSNFYGYTP
jgi:hypothetical protein